MNNQHQYTLSLQWTGNTGNGTGSYRGYERSHSICTEGKTEILCSSDAAFRGDKAKYNPEEGSGYFTEVILFPQVTVKDASMVEMANSLHSKANEYCFIANSVKFPVHHQPACLVSR